MLRALSPPQSPRGAGRSSIDCVERCGGLLAAGGVRGGQALLPVPLVPLFSESAASRRGQAGVPVLHDSLFRTHSAPPPLGSPSPPPPPPRRRRRNRRRLREAASPVPSPAPPPAAGGAAPSAVTPAARGGRGGRSARGGRSGLGGRCSVRGAPSVAFIASGRGGAPASAPAAPPRPRRRLRFRDCCCSGLSGRGCCG